MKDKSIPQICREIHVAVDQILGEADKNRDYFGYICVNWADLRCVDVAHTIREDGSVRWEIEIEEAEPGNRELNDFVETELAKSFGLPVECFKSRTEW